MKRVFRLMLLAGLSPLRAIAQEAEPGGVYFTLDFSQSVEASTDRDLTTEEAEDDLISLTTLTFGAVTETRTDRLAFTLGSGLRISEGEFSDDGLNSSLSYRRESADASFEASISSRRDDIAFLRDLTDFVDDTGVIVLPDDFEDLIGGGIRAETILAAALSWGDTAPVGYRFSVSQEMLRYEDADAGLIDTDTFLLGFGTSLTINEVTTGNIDLAYYQSDDVGGAPADTTSITGALTFERPFGNLTASLTAARDEESDVFWAASIEQEFALPNGSLSGGIGVVEDGSGDPRLTGNIAFSYPRPTGQIDLMAAHSLSAGDDRATTTFSANYLQELTPVSSMRVGFAYAQASDSDGGDPVAAAGLSASYDVSLTEDWQVSVGARFDLRDEDGTRSDSSTFFVTLERPFSWRP